jgi:predicted nucleic acid-binding protein
MKSVIISDTSCLIILDKIDQLALLHDLYDEVLITPLIADEFGKALPS